MKIAYLLTSRLIGITLLGLVITTLLAIWMFSEMWNLVTSFDQSLLSQFKLCLLLIFMVGYPILYFLFAKMYAVKTTIWYLIQHKKAMLIDVAVQHILEVIQGNPELNQAVRENQLQSKLNILANQYHKKINTLQWPVRMLIKFILHRLPLVNIISEAMAQAQPGDGNILTLQKLLVVQFNKVTNLLFSRPKLSKLYVIILGQLAFFVVLKWYLLYFCA